MRHLRIPGQNLKSITAFKSQITNILREINKFDDNDKNEAISYIQNCINSETQTSGNRRNSSSSSSSKSHKKTKVIAKKSNKLHKTNGKREPFECNSCKFVEKNRILMFKHLETHIGDPLSCLKCRKTFNGIIAFKWHLTNYCKSKQLEEYKYKCTQCPKKFVTKRTLDGHLQGHKRNNCTYCDKVLTRRGQLIKHLLEVHSIKLERQTHKCEICEKSYIKKRSLFYHTRQHVPEKFVCLECGHIDETIENYENHKKEHDLHKLFTCSKCNDKFSRRQQYLLHLKRHNRYKCNTCKENFASRAKILRHKQLGHDIEGLQPKFICPHCKLSFVRENRLFIHLKQQHSGDTRTINCKYCKKTFSSFYAYYKHCSTIFHEKCSPEINDNVCKICGKHFTKKYVLKQHIHRVHNHYARQPFSCQYCNYETYNRGNIMRHSALHFRKSNEFTCEHCGKSCDNVASLKDHISYNHLQQKQFSCEKCDKAFKRNSELVRHRNIHSNERSYCCKSCDKTYKRLNHLKRHEQAAHNVVKESRKIKKVDNEIPIEINTAAVPASSEGKIVIFRPYTINAIKGFEDLKLTMQGNDQEIFMTIPDSNEMRGDEQLMNSFTPEKNWGIENDLYKYYNDVTLNEPGSSQTN